MRILDPERLIEQAALFFASFVWTTIVLVAIILFWGYQDVQARWDYVLNAPPEALVQAAIFPTATPEPTVTSWAGPGSTVTPTPTIPPTPVATQVVAPPIILPETLNLNDPTPVVVANLDSRIGPVNINPQPPSFEVDSLDSAQQTIEPLEVPEPAPIPQVGTSPTRLIINSVGIASAIDPVGWSVIQ